MNILDYINKDTVLFLKETNKGVCLEKLIARSYELGLISDLQGFSRAIEEREALISTGIGLGVAVPHAKIASVPDFFVITAVISQAISWDAIDQKPVSLVFLIGGPDKRQTDYLKLLSRIVLLVKNDAKREALFIANKAQDVIDQFSSLM
ncbi:MAG: PTS sugar transporter subunit IIA [Spirochaetales bacterium]|nr:PTS sugar transporter subunit IIA [Spirochaetales bacterium]